MFGSGYRSAAIFFEALVQDVGSLFTPLLTLAGVIGGVTLVSLAPSLREEIGAGAHTHYFMNDAVALAVEADRLSGSGDA